MLPHSPASSLAIRHSKNLQEKPSIRRGRLTSPSTSQVVAPLLKGHTSCVPLIVIHSSFFGLYFATLRHDKVSHPNQTPPQGFSFFVFFPPFRQFSLGDWDWGLVRRRGSQRTAAGRRPQGPCRSPRAGGSLLAPDVLAWWRRTVHSPNTRGGRAGGGVFRGGVSFSLGAFSALLSLRLFPPPSCRPLQLPRGSQKEKIQ